MLATAAASPASDANYDLTALLLFIHSARLHHVSRFRSFVGTNGSGVALTNVPAELRVAFFSRRRDSVVAAGAPPGQDQTTSGIEGEFMIIRRLMPIFQQYAPRKQLQR